MMRIKKLYFKKNGMTLPELTIAMFVLVIFFGVISVYTQYFQKNFKLANILDSDKKSWTFLKLIVNTSQKMKFQFGGYQAKEMRIFHLHISIVYILHC